MVGTQFKRVSDENDGARRAYDTQALVVWRVGKRGGNGGHGSRSIGGQFGSAVTGTSKTWWNSA